jgi:colanic acid/amylovoran biosynthesis glycosyltransferase
MVQSDFPETYGVLARYRNYLDAVVGVSEMIRRNVSSQPGLVDVPSYYIPYGVPMPSAVQPRRLNPTQPIKILYPGRLCREQKRVHLFPEIYRQLREMDVSFHWTIAGDGPELSRLKQQMPSCPPDAVVEFLGAVAYEDMPGLFDSSHVLLLASDHEGLPLSLLEAMGHGLVPVVSRLPSGISEVVDHEAGILVDPSDVAGYARAIHALRENTAMFESLSVRARQRARDYSVDAMTERWLEMLGELAARKPAGAPRSWPSQFQVRGVLDHRSVRYSAAGKFARRLARRWAN